MILSDQEENYEPSSAPLEGTTNYMKDYPGHFILPQIRKASDDINQGHLKKNTGKQDFKTTTKEHYKRWVPEPSLTFGELPSFTDSILYPDQRRSMETTTGTTFKGAPGKRSDLVPHSDGNIKIEGEYTSKYEAVTSSIRQSLNKWQTLSPLK